MEDSVGWGVFECGQRERNLEYDIGMLSVPILNN